MRPRVAAAVVLVIVASASNLAQRLPVTTYSPAAGLPHDYTFDVLVDTRGFIWFATQDGVSRYDGTRFVNYSRDEGVPDRAVNSLLETRGGMIWVATNGGGVARFDPRGVEGPEGRRQFFRTFRVGEDRRTNRVNRLGEDDAGGLWAATDGGLFYLANGTDLFARVPLADLGVADDLYISDVVAGQGREVWLGTTDGLIRRLGPGRGQRYEISPDPTRPFVRRVVADRQGRLWIVGTGGVFVLARPPVGSLEPPVWRVPVPCPGTPGELTLPERPGDGCHIGVAHGLASGRTLGIGLGPDDRVILVHGSGGVTEIARGRVTVLAAPTDDWDVSSATFDAAGNLWMASQAGAKRLLRGGFVTYGPREGLTQHGVRRVMLGPNREVLTITYDHVLHHFDGERLRPVRVNLPPGTQRPTWAMATDFITRSGDWWSPTRHGLYRFHRVRQLDDLAQMIPEGPFTTADGLAADEPSALFEDSRGTLWVGHVSIGGPAISRRDPATGRFATVPIEGLPRVSTIVTFAEDRTGQIWAGMRDGGVVRLRHGVMRAVPGAPALPGSAFMVDTRGRLWMGTAEGVMRIENPEAETVTARRFESHEGMHVHATALVEDLSGRMFLGSLNGVVQYDPERGTSRRYSDADGLPSANVYSAVRDTRGDLWFGTARGLARLRPADLVTSSPGQPRLASIRVGDRQERLSEFGEAVVTDIVVAPDQNRVRIDYFALGAAGRPVRFQHRLSADEPWSEPSDATSVELARLAPGRYRFELRVVDPVTGLNVPGTASAAIAVLPVVWQRWWFLSLLASLAVAAAYAAHRYRLAGALRLERIRARIATDLHDDIGSSLSQIAILSEVSRQRIRHDPGSAHEPLGLIADTSRELVDKMADIVWAVNPRRDSLSDLVYRMRRFADDTFGGADVRLRFTAPDSLDGIRLGPDVRRELLLILKESVTNIAKHARATEAEIDLRVDGARLVLTVSDNGTGFDPNGSFEGNGVESMRRRVSTLGGELTITSAAGAGTTVAMTVEA